MSVPPFLKLPSTPKSPINKTKNDKKTFNITLRYRSDERLDDEKEKEKENSTIKILSNRSYPEPACAFDVEQSLVNKNQGKCLFRMQFRLDENMINERKKKYLT